MAQICSQCNTKNASKNSFCKKCGAVLPANFTNPYGTQSPMIRKILCFVMILAIILSISTVGLYLMGVQPIYKESKTEYHSVESFLDAYQGNHSIFIHKKPQISFTSYANYYHKLYLAIKNSAHFDIADSLYNFIIASLVSYGSSILSYSVLTVLLILAFIFLLRESPIAKWSIIIASVIGLLIIISGTIISYVFVSYDNISVHNGTLLGVYHEAPQLSTLLLVPLLVQLPILGSFLCKKKPILEDPITYTEDSSSL